MPGSRQDTTAILKQYHDKGYAVMEIEDDDNEEEDDKGNKD